MTNVMLIPLSVVEFTAFCNNHLVFPPPHSVAAEPLGLSRGTFELLFLRKTAYDNKRLTLIRRKRALGR